MCRNKTKSMDTIKDTIVIGSSGTLGKQLKDLLSINGYFPTHEELDITDYNKVESYINNHNNINYLIHAGAITSIRECEENRPKAYIVNVEGTQNIIKAIRNKAPHMKLIYISTACVFDGKTGNYNENNLPYPENYYGLTKTISEELIKYSGLRYLIIRTNFVGREKWKYEKAFTDRFGTYLFADQVAEMIDRYKDEFGIIHVTGGKVLSMFELAKMNNPEIKPMTIEEYTGPRLTMDMTLDSVKIRKKNIDEIT